MEMSILILRELKQRRNKNGKHGRINETNYHYSIISPPYLQLNLISKKWGCNFEWVKYVLLALVPSHTRAFLNCSFWLLALLVGPQSQAFALTSTSIFANTGWGIGWEQGYCTQVLYPSHRSIKDWDQSWKSYIYAMFINQHTIVSTFGCQIPAQNPSSLLCQKPIPYKVRVTFSKPVHAARARIGLPGLNYGTFTAKPSSHHVHVTLHVILSLSHPSPPLPHVLLTQNPCTITQRLSSLHSVQYDVTKSVLRG